MTEQVTATEVDTEAADALADIARKLNLRLETPQGMTVVKVDGVDITAEIRTPEISRQVAEISKIAGVREAMVNLQRQLAGFGGVVMDGRDIGTHVLPGADIKIFLTASIAERARRRWLELREKGFDVDLAELTEEIASRDKADCERAIAPLIQAADAVLVDTTDLTVPRTVDAILSLCEEKSGVL